MFNDPECGLHYGYGIKDAVRCKSKVDMCWEDNIDLFFRILCSGIYTIVVSNVRKYKPEDKL